MASTPGVEGDRAANRAPFKGQLDAVAHVLLKHFIVRRPIFQSLEIIMKATSDVGMLLMNDDRVIGTGKDDGTRKPRRPGADDADEGLVSIDEPGSGFPVLAHSGPSALRDDGDRT